MASVTWPLLVAAAPISSSRKVVRARAGTAAAMRPTRVARMGGTGMEDMGSRLPSFLDHTEGLDEHRLLGQDVCEPFDERAQPVFWHGRDEFVEHGALAEQRVRASR